MRADWLDSFYLSLNGWPGDEAGFDAWFTYIAWDGL
jgi:hypothetical protein